MPRVPNRDALQALVSVPRVTPLFADGNGSRAQRLEDERELACGDDLTDEIYLEQGRVRRRAHLTDDYEPRLTGTRLAAAEAVGGHVEQQIRETQVGQQVPRRHQPFEVATGARLEAGVLVSEVQR